MNRLLFLSIAVLNLSFLASTYAGDGDVELKVTPRTDLTAAEFLALRNKARPDARNLENNLGQNIIREFLDGGSLQEQSNFDKKGVGRVYLQAKVTKPGDGIEDSLNRNPDVAMDLARTLRPVDDAGLQDSVEALYESAKPIADSFKAAALRHTKKHKARVAANRMKTKLLDSLDDPSFNPKGIDEEDLVNQMAREEIERIATSIQLVADHGTGYIGDETRQLARDRAATLREAIAPRVVHHFRRLETPDFELKMEVLKILDQKSKLNREFNGEMIEKIKTSKSTTSDLIKTGTRVDEFIKDLMKKIMQEPAQPAKIEDGLETEKAEVGPPAPSHQLKLNLRDKPVEAIY